MMKDPSVQALVLTASVLSGWVFFPAVAAPISAQPPIVAVHWVFKKGDGRAASPSAAYLATLKNCGVQPKLTLTPESFPVSKVLCPGVLDTESSAALKARVNARLGELIAKDVTEIGGLKLPDLQEKISAVTIGFSEWGIFESALDSPGTPRRFAVNIEEIKAVILNANHWALFKNSEFADTLLIHEILGALGHRDEQYEITLAIWWLSLHPERVGPLSKKLPDFIKVARKQFAGISVVGHGGDPNQLIFKASLLALTTKKLEVQGVPARLIPSRADLEALILTAPISSASQAFMAERGLCDDERGGQSATSCGGFTLKGATGKPFLLISDEWGAFPSEHQRRPLVQKIYSSMVRELICSSAPVCGGR